MGALPPADPYPVQGAYVRDVWRLSKGSPVGRPQVVPMVIQCRQEAATKPARSLGADHCQKIGSHKPGAPMAKELKTSAELNKLLHERVARSSVGRIPNPQWIRIIPADPAKEGANWKVAHGSRTVPSGACSDAIERVMRELQKDYDLIA